MDLRRAFSSCPQLLLSFSRKQLFKKLVTRDGILLGMGEWRGDKAGSCTQFRGFALSSKDGQRHASGEFRLSGCAQFFQQKMAEVHENTVEVNRIFNEIHNFSCKMYGRQAKRIIRLTPFYIFDKLKGQNSSISSC